MYGRMGQNRIAFFEYLEEDEVRNGFRKAGRTGGRSVGVVGSSLQEEWTETRTDGQTDTQGLGN